MLLLFSGKPPPQHYEIKLGKAIVKFSIVAVTNYHKATQIIPVSVSQRQSGLSWVLLRVQLDQTQSVNELFFWLEVLGGICSLLFQVVGLISYG